MVYQIGKLKVAITYNNVAYSLTGLDTIEVSTNTKNTRIFPKDGSGSGITQTTGKNEGDTITFSSTYLPLDIQKLLIAIHKDISGYCTVLISSEELNSAGEKNSIVLDFATVENIVFQSNIDETSVSKYKIVFKGKLKRVDNNTR